MYTFLPHDGNNTEIFNFRQKSVVKYQIEVYCRIRPLENAAEPLCLRAKDKETVVLFSPETSQLNKIIKEVKSLFQSVQQKISNLVKKIFCSTVKRELYIMFV